VKSESVAQGLSAEFDGRVGFVEDPTQRHKAMNLTLKANILRGHAC
jgi:hypothetical protein